MLYREPTSGNLRPTFVSVDDAAKILGLGRWTIFQLIKDEEIRSTKFSNRRLVLLDSVDQYAKRLMEQSEEIAESES